MIKMRVKMRHLKFVFWSFLVTLCLPITSGCSCTPESFTQSNLESLCQDYEFSTNVFVARVLNASCNCIPSVGDAEFFQNVTEIYCAAGSLTSGQFTSRVVTQGSCDVGSDLFGVLSCDSIMSSLQLNECPYEGQVLMDCAPLCRTTCSNYGQASPCPAVCVRGCGCPRGMVVDEDQRRCVMPSQCPNKTCPIDGQIMKPCASSCPQGCRSPTDIVCPQVCVVDGCECEEDGEVVDEITGRCVQQQQCTACPIDDQEYTTCGSSCPRTCDNFNDTIICTTDCWQGCECPSGTVIDVENRRCVEPSQCGREMPTIVDRVLRENGRSCDPNLVCPHNVNVINDSPDNICQYTVEIVEVFKGSYQMGQIIKQVGPDVQSTCGNPRNILRVGTTYIVGIGGPCSHYSEWTPYSDYPTNHLEVLSNNCSPAASATSSPTASATISPTISPTGAPAGSSAGISLPSLLMLYVSATVVYLNRFV